MARGEIWQNFPKLLRFMALFPSLTKGGKMENKIRKKTRRSWEPGSALKIRDCQRRTKHAGRGCQGVWHQILQSRSSEPLLPTQNFGISSGSETLSAPDRTIEVAITIVKNSPNTADSLKHLVLLGKFTGNLPQMVNYYGAHKRITKSIAKLFRFFLHRNDRKLIPKHFGKVDRGIW